MKKPEFAAVPTETKPFPGPGPNCPTCFSGIDPTIRGIEFAAALSE